MPQYVVQQHFRSESDWHFDLMLEARQALVTFACPAPPDRTDDLPCLARQLADHRLAYLEYEGEISGGRDRCEIYDRGTFEWIEPEGGALLECATEIRIRLKGEKAKGDYILAREPVSGTDYWRLRKVTE
ncbi:MAG: DNA polymerase ligase N-terminal domain-containing protein [Phycisphaerae bacterium]